MSLCMSWQHYFNHRELRLMLFACRESLLLCCCHEAKKMSRCQKKNVAWPALIILFFYVRPTAGWSPGPEKAAALREEIERLNCRQHFITAKPARQENAVPQASNDDNKMSSLQLKKSAYFNTGWCLCRSVRLFSTPYPSLLLRVSTLSTLHMLYWMLLYPTMTLLKKKAKNN